MKKLEMNEVISNFIYSYNEIKKHRKDKIINGNINDHSVYVVNLSSAIDWGKKNNGNSEWLRISTESYPTSNISIVAIDEIGESLFCHCFVSSNSVDNFLSCCEINTISKYYSSHISSTGQSISFHEFNREIATLLSKYLINQLGKKETFLSSKKVSLTRSSGKTTCRDFIYVSNKKNINNDSKLYSVSDWKFSWEVMGHWRQVSGVGKDRSGLYNQEFRTWVNPSVKGNGELVKKMRVVK